MVLLLNVFFILRLQSLKVSNISAHLSDKRRDAKPDNTKKQMKSELILRTTEILGTILAYLCLFACVTAMIVSTFAFNLGMTIGLFAVFGLLLSSLPMNIRNL